MSLAIILCFALITFLDVPDIVQHKEWRMLVVYGIVWTVALIILILYCIGVEVPSPLKAFDSIFKTVFSPLYAKQ